MNTSKIAVLLVVMLGLTVTLLPRGFTTPPDQKITPQAADAVEVQTRGPIHEGYAAPVNSSPRLDRRDTRRFH
jgi:hypothetical protein